MATTVELQSSFYKQLTESEEYKKNVKAIEDWFTSAQQTATAGYQATAQTAAEQASYDISGAYANYLKQQRAVASQGKLESGYKEELGDIAQTQYQSAYGQAKATEAQTVASAAQTATEDIAKAYETASKRSTELEESLIKEAKLQASIYKKAEQGAGLSDWTTAVTQYGTPIYGENGEATGATGLGAYTPEGKLTGMGTALMQEYLMKDRKFLESLSDEEAAYYMANAQKIHKDLFGFEDTEWNETTTKEAKLKTTGYIESIERPTSTGITHWNITALSTGEKKNEKLAQSRENLYNYGNKIGLSKQETDNILAEYDTKLKALEDRSSREYAWDEEGYDALLNDTSNKMLNLAKSKYRGA